MAHRIASALVTIASQLRKAFVQLFKIDPLSSLATTANLNESLEQATSTFNFTIPGGGLVYKKISREVWLIFHYIPNTCTSQILFNTLISRTNFSIVHFTTY
jgi:hypothetical protein